VRARRENEDESKEWKGRNGSVRKKGRGRTSEEGTKEEG
jgi:hypothetical protein